MIWRIKDLFVNLFLKTRLWFYLNFKPSKFKNINNPIEKNGWDLTFNDEFNDGKLENR
jgi:hypothetical protein